MIVINVGHPERSDRLEKVLTRDDGRGASDRAARPERADEHDARGHRRAGLGRRAARAAPRLPAGLQAVADATAGRLAAPLRGGRVYTDDVAPVEWLIDTSIVQVAARGER